jgi:hypothetical protein
LISAVLAIKVVFKRSADEETFPVRRNAKYL